MAELIGAEVVARILKEEGVTKCFGIHGGHVWALMAAIGSQGGIKIYHMRHEQSACYAADGWARSSGQVGVCFATAGPGFGNMVPALMHSYLVKSPVVALLGQHQTMEDEWGPFQEAYAERVCGDFTKWTKRIVDYERIAYFVRKAFRDAATYPPGPVVLELPVNLLGKSGDEDAQVGSVPKKYRAEMSRPAGDPEAIEKAVDLLLEAKKPIAIGGDGLFWSKASDELKEFIELLQVPVNTRRMGRGAVSENHPLSFSSGYRKALSREADVILLLGLKMNMLEGFGLPPTYPKDNVKYILVGEDTEELTTRMPSETVIMGSPKLVLRQMIECAKRKIGKKPAREEWLETLANAKAAYTKKNRESLESVRDNIPLHPDVIASELVEFLDDDATIILDSYSMAGFTTDKICASFAGQVLDAGTWGGVGHGVGMAIGSQLARQGKQVVTLLGDGGLGVAGWDIETAARYDLPIIYFLFNNSSWMGIWGETHVPGIKDSWCMLQDIRYDKVFSEMNCHTELVTEPGHIRPALERACKSGKTSVINVIPDCEIIPPQFRSRIKYYQSMLSAYK